MANVRCVAQYILEKQGTMTTWKLQKLVYFCQAWSLVWDDAPLFEDDVEAWANGPVVRSLYNIHAGQFQIGAVPGGNSSLLNETQRETIDAVLAEYGDKSSLWLRDLTHMEDPWIKTRERAGLQDGDRGSAVITHGDMADYYGSL
jgi:uncharacterized phage-associated protein